MIDILIAIASGLVSTTYGWNEYNCGDIGSPRPCSVGAITASGEPFDPDIPTAAVFAPTALPMRAVVVSVRLGEGVCRWIRVNDKGNPRYIGERGFDITPATIKLLGGTPTKFWSGEVNVCLQTQESSILEILNDNLRLGTSCE